MSQLQVEKSFTLCASERLIACGCSAGIVQLLYADTLMFAGNVLYSKSKNTNKGDKDFQHLSNLADAVACQFSTPEKLGEHLGNYILLVVFFLLFI